MKNVLVAGGAGFLGSHLCERLLAMDCHVICVDDFSTGRQENIEALKASKQFSVLCKDVSSDYDMNIVRMDSWRRGIKIDTIFNFASPASPVHYQADPIKTTMTNVMGTKLLLDVASSCGAVFVQASTSEVYGDPEQHPQREEYRGAVNCTGPRSCYDEAKRMAESLCFDYRRCYKIDARVARIFNTYGPRMQPDDGRVVSNFIVQALQGNDITVYGDGSQTRSFCYVDDLIDGFIKLATLSSSEVSAGPFNLGNPYEITVLAFAELVLCRLAARNIDVNRVKIVHKKLPTDDPCRRKPDISKAKEMLQWLPDTALERGLEQTIDHFVAVLKKGTQ